MSEAENEGLVFHERKQEPATHELYSSADVARIFRVDVKTVSRWAERGEFEKRGVTVHHTIGGHRRYFKTEIHKLFTLMLDGKLYNEDGTPHTNETGSLSRIDDLPEEDSDYSESE